jgi:hypothetical protein
MKEYVYQSWRACLHAKFDTVKDVTPALRKEINRQTSQPDLLEFCGHQIVECVHMIEFPRFGDLRSPTGILESLGNPSKSEAKVLLDGFSPFAKLLQGHWVRLFYNTETAIYAIENGGLSEVAKAFYDLGEAAQSMYYPEHWEYKEILEKAQKRRQWEKTNVTQIRNLGKKALKKVAQDTARERWRFDANEEIRIAEMCEIIWASFCNIKEAIPLLPDSAAGIKPWIRPIAKEYAPWAMRKGAPKKKI